MQYGAIRSLREKSLLRVVKVSQDRLELRRIFLESKQVILRVPQAQQGNIALLVGCLEPRETVLPVAQLRVLRGDIERRNKMLFPLVQKVIQLLPQRHLPGRLVARLFVGGLD